MRAAAAEAELLREQAAEVEAMAAAVASGAKGVKGGGGKKDSTKVHLRL